MCLAVCKPEGLHRIQNLERVSCDLQPQVTALKQRLRQQRLADFAPATSVSTLGALRGTLLRSQFDDHFTALSGRGRRTSTS